MAENHITNYWVSGMLDEKKLEEIWKKVPLMLQEKEITKKEENKKFVSFYVKKVLNI